MNIREIIKKVQSQPEWVRKTILWVVLTVVGAGLLFLWAKNAEKRISSLQGEKFNEEIEWPDFGKELEKMNIPIVTPSEEELRKLEELIKEAEEAEKENPLNSPDQNGER